MVSPVNKKLVQYTDDSVCTVDIDSISNYKAEYPPMHVQLQSEYFQS